MAKSKGDKKAQRTRRAARKKAARPAQPPKPVPPPMHLIAKQKKTRRRCTYWYSQAIWEAKVASGEWRKPRNWPRRARRKETAPRKPRPQWVRDKIRATMTGRIRGPPSDATKAKLREAALQHAVRLDATIAAKKQAAVDTKNAKKAAWEAKLRAAGLLR